MSLKITPISQRDNQWKYKKLGYGTGTIGSYGCLLVSYTMLLNYFGIKKNPIEVNDAMKKAGGYVGDTKNLWTWAVADKIYKTKYQGSFAWNNSKVLNWINKGVPVIVKVDGKPIGGLSHYVLAIGGGKIADPFTGKIENFSKYKPLGYHVYTFKGGDNLSPPYKKELDICNKQHTHLMSVIDKKDKKIKNLEKKIETLYETINVKNKVVSGQVTELTKYKKNEKVLIDKLETAGEKFVEEEKLHEKWLTLYKQMKKNNISLKTDNGAFQTTITKIKNTSFKTAETKIIFLEWVKRLLKVKEDLSN